MATTATAYSQAWPGEDLPKVLTGLLGDPDYKTLPDRRNVLAHRVAPGLNFRLGNDERHPGTDYAVAIFDERIEDLLERTLTSTEKLLGAQWTAADYFAIRHSPEFHL